MLLKIILVLALLGVASALCRADEGIVPQQPPTAAAQASAQKAIQELHAAELAKTSSTDRIALAAKFIEEGKLATDSASRFEFFWMARNLGCDAQDMPSAMAAVDTLDKYFIVDVIELKIGAILSCAASSRPAAGQQVSSSAGQVIDEIIATDQFQSLAKMTGLPDSAAIRAAGATTPLKNRLADAALVGTAYEKAQFALKKLQTNEGDAQANLTVGKYRCFFKGDWKTGLTFLTKSSDNKLADLAKLELGMATDSEAIKKLADDWWALAEMQEPIATRNIHDHCVEWYSKALNGLTGLSLTQAQRRISVTQKERVAAGLAANSSRKNATPVPDQTAQTKALKAIADVYKPYPPAKPHDQYVLSVKLLDAGRETTNDPAMQYVLFRESAKLAAYAGMRAVEWTVKQFDVEENPLMTELFKQMAPALARPEKASVLLLPLLKFSDRALRSENFDLAVDAANAADQACRVAKDAPMETLVKEQRRLVLEAQTAFASMNASIAKLNDEVNDPAANLTAGKFYCFLAGAWEKGLPMLAKGSDAAMAELAKADTGASYDSASERKVGDGWWDFAKTQTGSIQRGAYLRAAFWYGEVLPSTTGLSRPLLEKRFDEAYASGHLGMQRLIELLPHIKIDRDTVGGKWMFRGDSLQSDKSPFARMQTPYLPPLEYDYRIEFIRLDGNDAIVQMMTAGSSHFSYNMGAGNNTAFHFDRVEGNNPSVVNSKNWFENNYVYTAHVQVRKDSLKTFLNGRLITSWKPDFSRLSLNEAWNLRDPKCLGVGSWQTSFLFISVAVIEVNSAGWWRKSADPQ